MEFIEKQVSHSRFLNLFIENLTTYQYLYFHKFNVIASDLKDSGNHVKKPNKALRNEVLPLLKTAIEQEDLVAFEQISNQFQKIFGQIGEEIIEAFEPITSFMKEYSERIRNMTIDEFLDIEHRMYLPFLFSELENYIYRFFHYVYFKDPRKLSGKNVSIKDIIGDKNNMNLNEIQGLVPIDLKSIITKKVEDIIEESLKNKKGYKKTFEKARDEFDIQYNISNDLFEELEFYKKIRNLFAHGDGTIDYRFLDNKKPYLKNHINSNRLKIGEKFPLNLWAISQIQDKILKVLKEFDRALVKKYPELTSN